jgi:hypothetical protein
MICGLFACFQRDLVDVLNLGEPVCDPRMPLPVCFQFTRASDATTRRILKNTAFVSFQMRPLP